MKIKFLLLIFISLCAFSSCNKELKENYASMLLENESLADSLTLLKEQKEAIALDYGRLLEQSSLMEGVFFEVQIGAFAFFDLSKYNENFVRIRNAQEAGLNKYVLGRFIEYQEASKFKKDIQKLGIEDAFIVGYVDGNRVEINEAINAAKKLYGI